MDTLLVWPVILPLVGAVATFLVGRRGAVLLALLAALGIVMAVASLAWQVWHSGPQRHAVGGWHAPLGIDLYADGLTVVMLLMSAVVGTLTSIYAVGYFSPLSGGDDVHDLAHTQDTHFFWPIWLFLWAALHALVLAADVFNGYVTLELLGLAAVALVNLAGGQAALTAGMRYLLTSLLGSMSYLLGVAILYAVFGTLDMQELSARMSVGLPAQVAVACLLMGLVLKTALFPLHFWLPPAHANAPAPVSVALSALVVKASFYLLLRLWLYVFPSAVTLGIGQLLGVLGGAAILWGSLLAVRQRRLKLLVAYSTVAQIGYLFLLFPMLATTAGVMAWNGGVYHVLSHAFAKGAMFMAAGAIMRVHGHDRINEMAGVGQQAPLSVFAFALAGVTLMGLPPSGGFIAKWLLLNSALESGQWWSAMIIVTGGLFAARYVFSVLQHAFTECPAHVQFRPAPPSMEVAALVLAIIAITLGLTATPPLTLLQIGAPFSSGWAMEIGR
jgi:formate hydrogenlyase subunit 3/multisubunit Na+/H+ antiporter MnhD subunit